MNDPNEKCFARPKVRFSRSDESPNRSNDAGAFAKPKIRSIVDFRPSVKILKAPSFRDSRDRSSSPEEINLRYSVGDAPNDHRLCPLKTTSGSAPCLTEIVLTPENHRSSKVRNLSDRRETSKTAPTSPEDNSLRKNEKSSRKSASTFGDKSSRESLKNESSGCKVTQKKLSDNRLGKENVAASRESKTNVPTSRDSKKTVPASRASKENIPKAPQNTPKTLSDSGTRSTSVKSSKTVPISRRSEPATKTIGDNAKSVKSKPPTIGLMPCMKAARDRCKNAPTKKTTVRDVTASPSRVYVGPGIARPRSLDTEIRSTQRPLRSRSEILSGDKLSRPEYNSIVTTMKKLQDARDERVFPKDLKHLPDVYQRLVNGKVSSALDFGANEAIYRDLVDLTIDEKQLPSRLKRSKDPEPRQRDLVPKLSDFFVPTNDVEYRKAVVIRPPSPRILDTWNPYKVSDRIFSWKESLDHDH